MKILLTGAGGFLGRALLPALRKEGHEVTLLSRRPLPAAAGCEQVFAETSAWPERVRGRRFDLCAHLAWVSKPGSYLDSPENGILATATIGLARELFRSGTPHFLGIGTGIEYAAGHPEPCEEDRTPIKPVSVYGKAKRTALRGVAAAAEDSGAGYTWVRLFYPYGAGENPGRITTHFLRSLGEGAPLELRTPDSIKDFIEIRDVTSALHLLCTTNIPRGPVNLGSGEGVRIGDLAELAARLTGADPTLIQRSRDSARDPYPYHVASITKLRSVGWRPAVSLEAGMLRLLSTLRSPTP